MTDVDQFESVFRSATKERFVHEAIEIERVLLVADLEAHEATLLAGVLRGFLRVLEHDRADGGPAWEIVTGDRFRTVPEMLALVEAARPDLVCTYRHLHSEGWRLPFTLGDHVEVLTQATTLPVLVIPHPRAERAAAHALENTNAVMAITDHLTGAHGLVSAAARLVEPGGTLYLTHVEDEAALQRTLEVISKIPQLDTDIARAEIPKQLLKEPHDYVASCREGLAALGLSLTVEEIVTVGHRLVEYKRLIESHEIDLLVFNTNDEDQLAMHGLAYPLAVEMRQIPLLLL